MKKIVILAISAILVANVSAQELKHEKHEGKKLNKQERVEFDIKRLTHELMLSDQQAEKFAVTYREYAKELDKLFERNAPKRNFEPGKEPSDKELDILAKQRFEGYKALADLQSRYYDKFRKDLSARQVEKVLRLDEPFGQQPCCGKHDGPKCEGKAGGPQHQHFEGGRELPGPERSKKHAHQPALQPAPQAPQAE